jgi:integrase
VARVAADFSLFAEANTAETVGAFQFRDLRAKAGTDQADTTDIRTAQQQLGHKSIKTTEIYVRARKGQKVKPTR